jgi:hypothetical protein
MKKLILLLALVSQGYSYTQLTLVDCQIVIGGYKGIYKSFSGEYYVLSFRGYCPYSYIIK